MFISLLTSLIFYMKRQYNFFIGTFVLAAFVLVLPVVARAQDLVAGVIPTGKGTIVLTAQVGGFAGKGGAVSAPPGADITLAWTLGGGWTGCLSNWQEGVITGSGLTTRTINAQETKTSFNLVLTCYKLGQAQTAKVIVNVVKPDLSIVSFTGPVPSTKVPPEAAVPGRKGFPATRNSDGTIKEAAIPKVDAIKAKPHKNEYYDGTISFKTIIKNTSKSTIPGNIGITTRYSWANTSNAAPADWHTIGTKPLETTAALESGAIPNVVPLLHPANESPIDANGRPTVYYFKAEIDSADVVKESNEKNNARIIGPYIFVKKVK